jgi:gliding motility-associated-like protein
LKRFILLTLIAVTGIGKIQVFAQFSNLEFVTNNGQWDKRIKFKGTMNSGAFFLEEKGFRVVQHKSEDLAELENRMHGISKSGSAAVGDGAMTPNYNARNTATTGSQDLIVHSHAYDVEFVNAGIADIEGDKALKGYNNYFIGNDPSKWKSNCLVYQAVNYQNMYNGIDVRYYTNEGQLKYDLVVHPGADYTKIAMKYDGVDGLSVKNGQLLIKTSVGEVRELAPYAFQVIDGQKREVACQFKVIGNTVQFVLGNYSKNATLVIDPTLIFSTFTGSTADNWGYTATYGPDGSFYAGGIVFATGFPVSTGAYQTNYKGGAGDEEGLPGYDMGIIKFTPNGNDRSYATYIGGTAGNEQPHSLVVDAQNELVIAGRTGSTDYPATVPNYGPCGGYDIVVTKLNSTGTALIGSVKIGGGSRDGVNIRPKYGQSKGTSSINRNYGDDARSEVILDGSGDILLASNSQSGDFPTTANSFQRKLAGGADNQDAVILKLSPDLKTVIFSTFLGGTGNDAAFVLALNPLNSNVVYVGGNTVSTNFPGDKSGVLYAGFQGGETDGFVSIISSDGTSLLKTTYAGTSGNDMLYGIQFDKFGFPYIMGTTTGNWPVSNARFSQPGGKQFISKFKPDLSAFEYSTVFGSGAAAPNISPIAFLVDKCENVYVSGWGGSSDSRAGFRENAGTNGMSVTPDAIQKGTDNSDFYFFVLERNASSQLYGSFFGQSGGFGEHVDGGTSRFDRNGVIYQAMCANCGRDVPFPTSPGVWAPTNGSKACNLAAVKIAFNLAGVLGSIRSSIEGKINDSSGCVPLTVDFADTLAEGKRYVWSFGDGSADVESTSPTVSHSFGAIGNYRVRLVSIDSAKCNIADTVFTSIRVRTDKAVLDFLSRKLLPCDAFNYQFNNNSFVSPAGRQFNSKTFTWDFGDKSPRVVAGLDSIRHTFPGPGVYKVTLVIQDTNFCNAPDSIQKTLRIATNVKAAFETPPRGCAPYNAIFDNTSSGGQQFYWDFGDGTTSTEVSPKHLYPTPGSYHITLKAVDSSTCNFEDSSSFTIAVSDKPVASFTYSPNPPQENTAVQFFNTSIGASRYIWKYGDGDTLATTSLNPVQHLYNETKLYEASLIAINPTGCSDTARQDIQARIIPLLDVPNAFTPNGDGANDKLFVRGFGISRMSWRIYNRWGAVVFETSDRTVGWDGTYKGSMQPTEVYHYILDVEYSDGSKFVKKGDVTLLR